MNSWKGNNVGGELTSGDCKWSVFTSSLVIKPWTRNNMTSCDHTRAWRRTVTGVTPWLRPLWPRQCEPHLRLRLRESPRSDSGMRTLASPHLVTGAGLKLSSSGPGPRSGPGQVPGQVQKVQGPRTKRPGPGLTLNLVCHPPTHHHHHHHPLNFSWGDNHSKPLLNDF